jgi:hypothetical protein
MKKETWKDWAGVIALGIAFGIMFAEGMLS